MTKAKLIMLLSLLLAFAAGVTVGFLLRHPGHKTYLQSKLSRELGLTPEQREEMSKIWSDVRSRARRGQDGRNQALERERDEAIKALFSEEQKARYEEVMQEYSRKVAEHTQERRKVFQQAVERTKQILTESQRKKYEELLKKRPEMGYRHRPGNRKMERTEAPDTPHGEE